MTALELIIYPFQNEQYPSGYRIKRDGFITRIGASRRAESKHLTDAELAAEFESARCDAMIQRATGSCWAPLGETWSMKPEAIQQRAQTLLRFARAPHYYEEQE